MAALGIELTQELKDKLVPAIKEKLSEWSESDVDDLENLCEYVILLLSHKQKAEIADDLKAFLNEVDPFVDWLWKYLLSLAPQEQKNEKAQQRDSEAKRKTKPSMERQGSKRLFANALKEGTTSRKPKAKEEKAAAPVSQGAKKKIKTRHEQEAEKFSITLSSRGSGAGEGEAKPRIRTRVVRLTGQKHAASTESTQAIGAKAIKKGGRVINITTEKDRNLVSKGSGKTVAEVEGKDSNEEEEDEDNASKPASEEEAPTGEDAEENEKTGEKELETDLQPRQEEEEEDQNDHFGQDDPPAKTVGASRCRFWPNCTNKDCTFHHPSEPCKFFPKCTFGANCLNIHPSIPCKFGSKCTNTSCVFSHPPGRRMNALGSTAKAACKFGVLCTRKGCTFQHPKSRKTPKDRATKGKRKGPPTSGLCMFDDKCEKIGCPLDHPKRDAASAAFLQDTRKS